MIPVEAVSILSGEVSYTPEVPIRVRWVIADLGGSTVFESDVVITTDPNNELVRRLLEDGEKLIASSSLFAQISPNRELESGDSPAISTAAEQQTPALPSAAALRQAAGEDGLASEEMDEERPKHSADDIVDGEVLSADEHTAAIAGNRRTARTEVPESVLDEIEDAIALMSRSLRQGSWEQSKTHSSLVPYLREEAEELATTIALRDKLEAEGEGEVPSWAEQDLCEELSDVLLQVLFHAEIANRRGAFDIGHVAGAFVDKLRSRAPYLFEDVERSVEEDEQDELWNRGKKEEVESRREKHGKEYAEYLAQKKAAVKPTAEPADEAQPDDAQDAEPDDAEDSEADDADIKQDAEPAEDSVPVDDAEPADEEQDAEADDTPDDDEAQPEEAEPEADAEPEAEVDAEPEADDEAQSDEAAADEEADAKPAKHRAPADDDESADDEQDAEADDTPDDDEAQPDDAEPEADAEPTDEAKSADDAQDVEADAEPEAEADAEPTSDAKDVKQPAPLALKYERGSALSAAEEVIRVARDRGLTDAQIPTDIRYPMVGLELDEPGQAEDRLLKAVQKFRAKLNRASR